MVVLKNILWAVIALGLTTNFTLAEENHEGEKCVDKLDFLFAYYNLEMRSLNTKEWRSQFKFCNHRPTEDAPKLLQSIFGLDENSTPEDYKKPVKALKHAARPDSGYSQIYVPGFGSVPASVMGVKTRPVKLGDPVAQYLLWYIYSNGLTGKVKESKAKKYLKRAAVQGYTKAVAMMEETNQIESQ